MDVLVYCEVLVGVVVSLIFVGGFEVFIDEMYVFFVVDEDVVFVFDEYCGGGGEEDVLGFGGVVVGELCEVEFDDVDLGVVDVVCFVFV